MRGGKTRPVNIGNPVEHTVKEVAGTVARLSGGSHEVSYEPLPKDDAKQRCPVISRACEVLGWEPKVTAEEGLKTTLELFAERAEKVPTERR